MNTKLKKILQSDAFILSISLAIAFLCHLLVTGQTVASDKKGPIIEEKLPK